jgi:hypothetical protein
MRDLVRLRQEGKYVDIRPGKGGEIWLARQLGRQRGESRQAVDASKLLAGRPGEAIPHQARQGRPCRAHMRAGRRDKTRRGRQAGRRSKAGTGKARDAVR